MAGAEAAATAAAATARAPAAQSEDAWTNLCNRMDINDDTRGEFSRVGMKDLTQLESLDDDAIKLMVDRMLRFKHPERPENAVVYVSAQAMQNLKVVRYWIKIQRMTGIVPQPDGCNEEAIRHVKERIKELEAFKISEKEQDIPRPGKLDRMTKWQKFWEACETYFGSIRGAADIPLTYVFRKEATVTDADRERTYSSNDAMYIRITEVKGVHFMADNSRVWSEWKALVQDGPGWDFIKQFERTRDGRAAVLKLMSQNESHNNLTTRKNKAYTALEALVWDGPRRGWDFEQYVSGHLNAHNELEYCGEPVQPAKKVRDFLGGITDPRLEAAVDHARGEESMFEDFDKTQKYISLVHSNKAASQAGRRRSRQVAGLDHEKNPKNPKKLKKSNGKDVVTLKSYSKEEWGKLSQAQRDKVKQLRAALKASKGDGKQPPKREVAGIKVEDCSIPTHDCRGVLGSKGTSS